MITNCSSLFLSIVLIAVVVGTFGIGWRWIAGARREGAGDFDRNSILLISLLSVAFVSVFVFILYVFFRSFIC